MGRIKGHRGQCGLRQEQGLIPQGLAAMVKTQGLLNQGSQKGWPTQCSVCPETLEVGSSMADSGASGVPRHSSSPSRPPDSPRAGREGTLTGPHEHQL